MEVFLYLNSKQEGKFKLKKVSKIKIKFRFINKLENIFAVEMTAIQKARF